MDKDKLWNKINDEEEMSDEEKRETYQAEIDNEEAEREWENSQ